MSEANQGLLITKTHQPQLPPDWVIRARLSNKIIGALQHKLVLVSAPAGYGKTTAVTEALRSFKKPVGWVSLDSSDNVPGNFWLYLISALQSVFPGACQSVLNTLQSAQSPPMEWLLTTVINSISSTNDFVLALDDYHVIESPQVHEAVSFLVEHLPSQVHLMITSRIDPPLPLARWRVKGEIAEIRASDLSFTPEETAAFIKNITGVALSEPDLAALEKRTEGWVAGLKMAALSLQNKQDISGFIRNFSGSNRYIMDYLAEEVLNQQPLSIRQFLLETSILKHLSGPLCDAVTERSDSQTILTRLETANLFTAPLDDERCWYRYHQLFASILYNQLVKSGFELVSLLHHRASQWYEQQGLTEEAIEHAFLGGDSERAVDLLEKIAPTILGQGQALKLLSYRTRIPQSLMQSHPWICVSLAWAALLSHQWDLLSALLSQSDAILSGNQDRIPSTRQVNPGHIKGHLLSIQGYIAQAQGDIVRSIKLSEEANRKLPENDLNTLSANSINIAINYLILGDIERAIPYLQDANKKSIESDNNAVRLSSQAYLAEIELQCSRFDQAARICRETIALGTRLGGDSPLPHSAIAFVLLGQLLYEQNDLENAAKNVAEGIQLAESSFNWTFLLKGCLIMAELEQAQGNSTAANQFVQRAEEAASKAPQARESRQVPAWKAQLALRQCKTAAALDWARQQEVSLPLSKLPNFLQEFDYLTLVRVKLAKGECTGLPEHLDNLIQRAENQGRSADVIEILILKALSLEGLGETAEAAAAFDRSLALSEPAGYVRTFIDEGVPLAELLRKAVAEGKHSEYASKLLNLMRQPQDQSHQSPHNGNAPGMTEALSGREIEVLKLVAAGKTNLEIASGLFLAVGTIKRHIYNIFRKLGVDSRTQAIARARHLGII